MHDIKFLREHPAAFDAGLQRRGLPPVAHELLAFDEKRRAVQTSLQELQNRRNVVSKEIGTIKQQKGDASSLMDEVARIKENIPELELREKELADAMDAILSALPNIPADDVPQGADENDNVELRRVGIVPIITEPQDHVALGENLRQLDFDAAGKIAGTRFAVIKGDLARLERALGQFMLDSHTQHFGYTEVSVPLLVRDDAVYGTAQLPKFADDLFKTTDGRWLIPTSEVPLTNLVRENITPLEELPLRFTALSPCFRSEAGSAGRDTRGILRQHQFYKVELVSITAPEQSQAEHERMVDAAETILKKLELPFRTITLCTGDMGFAARKTYDIEVWVPSQNMYREISSCSNCGDFQARRMNARLRRGEGQGTEFVHTLNGSGVAVGRALLAVMENYQQPDGSIAVPTVLKPYMNGVEKIHV